MKPVVRRTIDPEASLVYVIEFTDTDLSRAFYDSPNPDEDLYYLIMSPAFLALSPTQQLLTLSRVATLASSEQASALNLVASPPVPERIDMPLEVSLSNEEKVKVTARPTTPGGNPAAVDGALRATIASGEGSFETDADPLSIWLITGSAPGDATFIVEVDADLGEGVTLIQDTVILHVAGAQAVALGMTASAPVPSS